MGLLRPTIFLPFVLLAAIALIFVSHDMVSHSKAEWDDRTLPLPVQARAFVAKVRTLAGRLRPVPGILPSHEQGTASAFVQETGSSMKQEVWARDAEMADPKLAAEVCRTKRASAALEIHPANAGQSVAHDSGARRGQGRLLALLVWLPLQGGDSRP